MDIVLERNDNRIVCKELLDLCMEAYFKSGGKAQIENIRRWLDEKENDEGLLEAAANYVDEINRSPLHYLVWARPPTDLVERLLQLAPDAVQRRGTVFGWLPLHFACGYEASVDVVQLLLEAYPKATEVQDNDGDLPLHIACYNGLSTNIVRMLLETYPKATEISNNKGYLPLHCACKYESSLETVKVIYETFPEAITRKDSYGKLPADYAYSNSAFSREMLSDIFVIGPMITSVVRNVVFDANEPTRIP